jgi:hypothetical protein
MLLGDSFGAVDAFKVLGILALIVFIVTAIAIADILDELLGFIVACVMIGSVVGPIILGTWMIVRGFILNSGGLILAGLGIAILIPLGAIEVFKHIR